MRYAEREVFASLPVPPVAIIGTQFAFKTLHLTALLRMVLVTRRQQA